MMHYYSNNWHEVSAVLILVAFVWGFIAVIVVCVRNSLNLFYVVFI